LILGFCFLAPSLLPLAAQPWRKPVADWSARDTERVLTNSPWARRAVLKRREAGVAPNAAPAGFAADLEKVTVRWESGAPVVHARQRSGSAPVPSEGGPCYLIAISGLPLQEPESARMIAAAEAYLSYGDGDPVEPTAVRLWRERDGRPLLVFQFPVAEGLREPGVFRAPLGIRFHRNEFRFEARIGPVEIKQRFDLREMLFLRRLAL
jgi:hypothetical protein